MTSYFDESQISSQAYFIAQKMNKGRGLMKKLWIAVAAFAVGSICQAGQLNCQGNYLFYHMTATAQTSGNKVVSDINIKVSGLGAPKVAPLTPTSSDVREGTYLYVSAEGKDGSGEITANYNAQTGTYQGTLKAQTSAGNANVQAECALTHNIWDADYDLYAM